MSLAIKCGDFKTSREILLSILSEINHFLPELILNIVNIIVLLDNTLNC